MGRAAVCAAVLALAVACTRPTQLVYDAEVAETPVGARHAVHSERIRELMAGLDRLERGRLPQAMDVELERDRRIDDVARAARDLAESAGELADLAPKLDLDAVKREAFVGHARALERDTRALADEAPVLSVAAMRERTLAIRTDCDRCHDQFRVDPNPVEP